MLSFNFFKAQNELGLKGQIQSRARTKSGSLQTKSVGFSGSVSSRFRTNRRDFFPTNRVFQTDHDEDNFFPSSANLLFKFETKRLKWKKKSKVTFQKIFTSIELKRWEWGQKRDLIRLSKSLTGLSYQSGFSKSYESIAKERDWTGSECQIAIRSCSSNEIGKMLCLVLKYMRTRALLS